jgi:hypothetical protein
VNQGLICESRKPVGGRGAKANLKLYLSCADSCKIRKKILQKSEKCKTSFGGFVVKTPTTFVILA